MYSQCWSRSFEIGAMHHDFFSWEINRKQKLKPLKDSETNALHLNLYFIACKKQKGGGDQRVKKEYK